MKKAHRFAKSDLNFRAGKVSDPAPETHPKTAAVLSDDFLRKQVSHPFYRMRQDDRMSPPFA